MTRVALAGCMALAALGAAAVLDVGAPAAEASPSASQFAGTYVWDAWPVPITISDGGQIASSYSGSGHSKGSISGRVRADGSYSFTMSVTMLRQIPTPRGGGSDWISWHRDHDGVMTPDLSGNLVVTSDRVLDGFVWLRQ